MAIEFVNHHVHSHFSTLDGLSTPEEIVQRAVDLGQRSISITDHGSMSGIPQLYAAAQKADIGFTPGCEVYFTTERTYKGKDKLGEKYYHMILLAHTNEGYSNLSKLQTLGWEEGYYHKPRIDYDALSQYSKGLSATTACLGGIVNQYLMRDDYKGATRELATLIDIFGEENTYVEIQNHGIKDQLKILGQQRQLAEDFGLKMIATSDSHYCHPHEADVHDSLLCAGTKATKDQEKRFKFESDQNFIHSGERMLELFPEREFPGAVSNTVELAEKTEFTMNTGKNKKYLMPITHDEQGRDDADILRDHVMEGARSIKRYGDTEGNIPDDVQERIDYELSVIKSMRFSSYFLIMENLMNIFRNNGINPGPGRGCLHPDTPVLTNNGWTPIKNVSVGDTVITASGDRGRVHDVLKHGVYEGEKLVKITNENGESIILTAKHKVYVHAGDGISEWKMAAHISPGDVIVSVWGDNDTKEYDNVGTEDTPWRIERNGQWGYVLGMSLSRFSTVSDSHIRWIFDDTDHESTLSQTLMSCLTHIVDAMDIHVDHHDSGRIYLLELNNAELSKWISTKVSTRDTMIGVGCGQYTSAFIQALHMSSRHDPDFKHITCASPYHVDVLEIAYKSLGAHTVKTDENSLVSTRKKSSGVEKFSMVIATDVVDADVDYVYDLTIAGAHPSFLTSFGTVHNSAPGSVAVYCLGITEIDPMEHDLYFERFLNPDRISMPDIDVDVPRSHRKKALKLIEEEYGKGHVAHLANYNKMGMRDALLRAAKVFGMTPSEGNKFRDGVASWCEDNGVSIKDLAQRGTPPDDLKRTIPETAFYEKIVSTAATFVGRMMGNGVHASGILITNDQVDKDFPIRLSKDAHLPVCQYDGTDTESIGGVKFDILGLINLDECENAEYNILADLGEEVDSSSVPLDDPEVYSLLSEGRGGGVFQMGCVAGDTIIDGVDIATMYKMRNSNLAKTSLRSVYLGKGNVAHNSVRYVVYSGVKDTITVSTSSHAIRCTPDHRLFTSRGWVPAGEITTDDCLMTVDDEHGYEGGSNAVRGREDVISTFLDNNKGYKEIDDSFSIEINNQVCYPTAYNAEEDRYAYLYPDAHPDSALRIRRESILYPEIADIMVMSHTEVMEQAYSLNGQHNDDYLPPLGCSWEDVTEISPAGECDTYDIIMKAPVHNFIANGIVTHNSSGISSLSRKMKPDEFENISVTLALYRPGPMEMGTHDEYCDRKNDIKPVDFFHEDAQEVLSKTYGLVCYQEDIMSLSRKFAGYTGAEADDLRKAMAKKNPEMMDYHRKKFIPAVNDAYGNNLGQYMWDIMEPFGKYAFNKSHSIAYAMLTYRTAWLKTHYPAQFAGAVMDENLSDHDKIFYTVSWIRKEGVNVLAPDVQKSERRSVTSENSISLPLHIIKGLGDSKAEDIINERNNNGVFSSVVDVVSRCKLSRGLAITMAKVGAFERLNADRAAVINNIDSIMSLAKSHSARKQLGGGLFGNVIDTDETDDVIDVSERPDVVTIDGETFTVDDDLYGRWERECMGVLLGKHPYGTFRNLDSAQKVMNKYPPIDMAENAVEHAKFSGMITNISNKQSKRTGNKYCTFSIETDSAIVPGITFSHIPDPESHNGSIVAVEGKIENDGNDDVFEPQAVCYNIKKINMEKFKEQG